MTWPLVAGATSYDVYRGLSTTEVSNYNNNATPLPTSKRVGTGVSVGAFTDPAGLASGTTHNWWVVAKNASGASDLSPSAQAVICSRLTSAEDRWRTASVCGTWQLLNPQGDVDQFHAVNVRGHSLDSQELSQADVTALSTVFDSVRLTLRWDQMQPANGTSIDAMWQERILDVLDRFQVAGVEVILDPVHLGGDDTFWIPDWAWQAQVGNAPRSKGASYPVWADNGSAQNNGQRVKNYLQELIDAGILNHPAVIGIEVVNEPHPRAGSGSAVSSAAQQQIATTYQSIAGFIRNHPDPAVNDDVIVLGAYHGGTRFGGELTGTTFDHPVHLSAVSASHPDTMWTAHNYYTGTGDTLDGRNDGLDIDGTRGVGFWVESAGVDAGCYVNGERDTDTGSWGCPVSPNRDGARAGHRNNAYGHWLYAQQAGMPFFMGEWGAPASGGSKTRTGIPATTWGWMVRR